MIALTENSTDPNEPILISDVKVAELLGISRRTVWRLLAAGRIPQPVRVASCVRWRYSDIKEWVEGLEPVRDLGN